MSIDTNVELYEKDGMIGILVSPGYGAGWSTWNDDAPAYDKRVVEFWLAHKDDRKFMSQIDSFSDTAAKKEAKAFFESLGYKSPYLGGFSDIELKWVSRGTYWRITAYDGSEYLETFENAGFNVF